MGQTWSPSGADRAQVNPCWSHELCLRDQTWLCEYCWCQTPEGVVSPPRAITRAQPDISLLQQVSMFFDGIACLAFVQPWVPRENSSWYIRSHCLVQRIFNQSPVAAYFEQFTGPCYSLWITCSSLWHQDYSSWTCCGLVSTVFSRKI